MNDNNYQQSSHDKALSKAISRRIGLMNNAKWLKVFDTLEALQVKGMTAKLLLYPDVIGLDSIYAGECYFESMAGAFYYKEQI